MISTLMAKEAAGIGGYIDIYIDVTGGNVRVGNIAGVNIRVDNDDDRNSSDENVLIVVVIKEVPTFINLPYYDANNTTSTGIRDAMSGNYIVYILPRHNLLKYNTSIVKCNLASSRKRLSNYSQECNIHTY
ncbi:Hypothetical predicted protein [Octopus vulgaris]|uniref:Uncharacterized protein n=1 Tax=Octopus vulgaris TaxID=6645 RepID=A0AA36B2J9_OCTVU|nr:Hypothetical predicted protein [Octopus vulgaris]